MPRCEKVLAGRGIAFGQRQESAEEAYLREAQEQGAGDVNETTIDEEPSNIDVEYLPVISENRFEEAQLGIVGENRPRTGSEEKREVEISNRGRFSPTDAKLSLFEAIFRDDRTVDRVGDENGCLPDQLTRPPNIQRTRSNLFL
ncbi:unnamed protein product [Caenorhabditis auriculariae]|uniref:Uncharacterized protein n=1 Tax=Caenorhabditis auriculariae TaxID=2777116 RepID=A0A8S1HCL4_9PELO|nr:unnamed protein product [Caenorhabditis auriculariae]